MQLITIKIMSKLFHREVLKKTGKSGILFFRDQNYKGTGNRILLSISEREEYINALHF